MVQRIAKLGKDGLWTANIERDFHTLLNSFRKRLGAKLTFVQARTLPPMSSQEMVFGVLCSIYRINRN